MKRLLISMISLAVIMQANLSAQAKADNPNTKATLYVSQSNGSNRNDGSKSSPFKNLQKALDAADEGSTILVAEGNYYGLMNSGNIIITKPVTIMGGYNNAFSERDILKNRTMVQPTVESNGSAQGRGTIQIRSVVAPDSYVIIDGLIMDRGNSISYNAGGEGKPEGVQSGQMNPIGTKGLGGPDLTTRDVLTNETNMIYLDGDKGIVNSTNIIVRNCAFINAPNYGIVGLMKGGSITVDNNIFVNIRMATMDVRGSDPNVMTTVDFRNNTVMFVWSRTRALDTMGYGFRYITGTSCNVENNIFGCACFSALDRTHIDSNKAREAKRVDTSVNNLFFLNRLTDLCLPGGGSFLRVRAEDFDDVEALAKVSGNRTMTDPSAFKGKINSAYLAGFINIKSSQTLSVDYDSTANQFNRALGLNIQGTGKTTASMFANRYPWEEALNLFGAVKGVGAQRP